MLTRFRIEVEGADSAASCEEELSKYEHALQVTEAQRFDIRYETYKTEHNTWDVPIVNRDFYNDQLGREVTDEVIEYDSTLPGYRGRRVVQFKRIDMRHHTFGRADDHRVGDSARESRGEQRIKPEGDSPMKSQS